MIKKILTLTLSTLLLTACGQQEKQLPHTCLGPKDVAQAFPPDTDNPTPLYSNYVLFPPDYPTGNKQSILISIFYDAKKETEIRNVADQILKANSYAVIRLRPLNSPDLDYNAANQGFSHALCIQKLPTFDVKVRSAFDETGKILKITNEYGLFSGEEYMRPDRILCEITRLVNISSSGGDTHLAECQ